MPSGDMPRVTFTYPVMPDITLVNPKIIDRPIREIHQPPFNPMGIATIGNIDRVKEFFAPRCWVVPADWGGLKIILSPQSESGTLEGQVTPEGGCVGDNGREPVEGLNRLQRSAVSDS
jgi:hypothetical protein